MAVKYEPVKSRTRTCLSVDLGKMSDPTALALLRRFDRPSGVWEFSDKRRPDTSIEKTATTFECPSLRRLPLLTDYPTQIQLIAESFAKVRQLDPQADLVVDSTGAGTPVTDMMIAAGLPAIAIVITSSRDAVYQGRQRWHVGKSLLVTSLEAKVHSGELRVAESLPEAETLRREFADFRLRHGATGAMLFEHRQGQHDDLLLSLAQATWWLSRPESGAKMIRLRGL